jgi:hypothetical protein
VNQEDPLGKPQSGHWDALNGQLRCQPVVAAGYRRTRNEDGAGPRCSQDRPNRQRRLLDPRCGLGCVSGADNPFVSHAFLSILERSGSAPSPRRAGSRCRSSSTARTARPRRSLPAYAKSHSQGEYVFDHGWADAWERAGGRYYPKLQVAVPFTPCRGRGCCCATFALAPALIAAIEAVTDQNGLSSAHVTLSTGPDCRCSKRPAG